MAGHSSMARVARKAAKRISESSAKNPKNYVASVGKMITATAILQLVEEGRISLDERVADILIRHAAPIAAVLAHAESR